MYIEVILNSVETQLQGVVLIVDFKGYGLNHVRNTSPFRLRQLSHYIQVLISGIRLQLHLQTSVKDFCTLSCAHLFQDSYPLLIKEVHLINYPYVFNIAYSIFRPFLKEKMKNRVSVCPMS